MKYLLLVCALLLLSGCCTNDGSNRCLALAKARYGKTCKDIKLISNTRDLLGRSITIDACGTRRYFEWGTWCEDCSYSCRELR